MSALIGRDVDVARVEQLLFGAVPSPVVTVTGPSGIGKSRLVREVVARVRQDRRHPVLALSDGAQMPADGTALLILDEPDLTVAQTRALVSPALGRLPAQLIVTSLAPLHVAGEQVHRLERLAVEPDGVALFTAAISATRRRQYDPAAVLALCAELSGLPLAVQAAAALAEAVPPEHLLRRLGEARLLDVLGDVRLPGARTLRAAVARTYGELEASDQALLASLAVLPATFAPDAAVAVGAGSEGATLAGLARLTVAGAVVRGDGRTGPRFEVPRALRELVQERRPHSAGARLIAVGHYRRIASDADDRYARGDEAAALAALAPERAALTGVAGRLAEAGDAAGALGIEVAAAPAALSLWWDAAAAGRLERCLRAVGVDADPALRVRARMLSARLAVEHAPDLPVPRGILARGLQDAVAAARAHGDDALLASAIGFAVEGMSQVEAPSTRARLLARARPLVVEPAVRAPLQAWRAVVHAESGHIAAARASFAEARELMGATPSRGFLAACVRLFALAPAGAEAPAADRLLAQARRLGDRHLEVRILTQLSRILLVRGAVADAARPAGQALELARAGGGADAATATAGALAVLVGCAAGHDDLFMAVQLSETLLAVAPRAAAAVLGPRAGERLTAWRSALGPAQAARARREAAASTLAGAVETGRALAERVSGPPTVGDEVLGDVTSTLTPREREVLIQLAHGASNKMIGYSLGMTPKTVMHHSMAIYRKLGVHSRAEAAVIAVQQDLVPPSATPGR